VDSATPIERGSSSRTVAAALSSTTPQKTAHRGRHSRYQTEFIPSFTSIAAPNAFAPPSSEEHSSSVSPMTPPSIKMGRGSATFSPRSGTRRARVSASVYEPPSISDGEESGRGGEDIRDDADAYRRRLEALKKDMGDGWLKVFSQSQMKTSSS